MEESLKALAQFYDDVTADARILSPLVLAFVGDGVFDLVIRTLVLRAGNRPVKRMHREKADIVNAGAQAKMAEALQPLLTEEEQDIFRRGRNAHPSTVAKNQRLADYRQATGLEALCGYLYLTGRTKRVVELIEQGLKAVSDEIEAGDEESGTDET